MTDQQPAQGTPATPPPRRTPQRILGGLVVLAFGIALFYGGVDSIAHPAETVAESSDTARAPDSEEEAKLGGVIMCMFGLTVLGFGVALLQKPKPKGEVFGSPPRPPK